MANNVVGPWEVDAVIAPKAFLFPTNVNEAFGLGMVEAMMSGTPVISSDRGACPELVSSDVGFVCKDGEDYVSAINDVAKISSSACRAKAMSEPGLLEFVHGVGAGVQYAEQDPLSVEHLVGGMPVEHGRS